MINNLYGVDPVRVNVDHISSYMKEADYTVIKMTNKDTIYTPLPPEEIDQILVELYFMVKK